MVSKCSNFRPSATLGSRASVPSRKSYVVSGEWIASCGKDAGCSLCRLAKAILRTPPRLARRRRGGAGLTTRGTSASGSIGALVICLLLATFASPPSANAKSGPWVSLDAGTTGAYNWSVKVKDLAGHPDAGAQVSERPCILVGASSRTDRFSISRSSSRQCAEISAPLTATSTPLIGTAAQPSDRASPKLTAIGMIFGAAVRRLRITFDGGHLMTVHLRRISSKDARAAGVAPLRYAAFTVPGAWRVERLVSFDATGNTLWDSGSAA